ncbi:MAG TPA: type II CAAX endopeptidase family protein [Polyangiaceae bacterium]
MEALFTRRRQADANADLPEPKLVVDLVDELKKSPETAMELEVSRSPTGPFDPFPQAFEDGGLREDFALALRLPAEVTYRKVRPFLFLSLLPLLMLLELDRELAFDAVTGSVARVLLDLVLVLVVARDLWRPLPRHGLIDASVLFGAAGRFTLLIAKSCGHEPHAIIYGAPVLALAMAIAIALASPSRRKVLVELHAALGLDPPPASRNVAPTPKESRAIWPALAIAIFLPPALWLSGKIGGLWIQAAVMVAWGIGLPQLVIPRVDDLVPRRSSRYSRLSSLYWGLAGIALTAGLTGGIHYLVDAVAQVFACSETRASAGASSFVANETREAAKGIFAARESIAFFVMTVGVSPLIEERVYRALLQRVATARFGPRGGIGVASVVFGLAHLGVYRVAVYQTILLGVSFGVAFEEGGLVASLVTHAVWNLYLLL